MPHKVTLEIIVSRHPFARPSNVSIDRISYHSTCKSGNSSMPPSSDDQPGRKPPQRRQRQGSKKRRPGKQQPVLGSVSRAVFEWLLPLESLGDGRELAQGGFQVFHDLAGNHVRRQQTLGVIEAGIPNHGDVQVYLVARCQLFVREGAETLGWLAVLPGLAGTVAGLEIV